VSFSFYVAAPDPPRFSAVVDAVAELDWACAESAPEDDRFPSGYCYHPYLRGRAARGVELCHEDGRFQVRIMTCSSRADYELALRLVDTLARMTGAAIEPEDGDALSREEAKGRYGREWLDKMVAWGADIVFQMVDREGNTLTMSGCKREVHVGPRFAAELRARAGDLTPSEQLLAAMIRIQNVDEDEYYAASSFRVTPKGKEEEDSFTLAAWAPGVAYVFPSVMYFAIIDDAGEEIVIPHEAGPAVALEKWTWLDERTALVEATPNDEWKALLGRARKHATTPTAPARA
jgi:hypothetical protein